MTARFAAIAFLTTGIRGTTAPTAAQLWMEVLTDAAFLPDKETAEKVHSLSGWAYKSNSQEQRATV